LWRRRGTLGAHGPGLATDLIPASETRWDGFYVGGQLGGAWSDTDWRYDNHNWFNTIGPALVGTDFDIDVAGSWAAARLDLTIRPDRG
jgi:hypothetical protein